MSSLYPGRAIMDRLDPVLVCRRVPEGFYECTLSSYDADQRGDAVQKPTQHNADINSHESIEGNICGNLSHQLGLSDWCAFVTGSFPG